MDSHPHSKHSLVELLVTLMIGLAPVACGLLVLVLQAERKQKDTIDVTAREAIYAIDVVIQSLHINSSQALSMAELSCEQALPELRRLAIKQPNVRSLALLKDNRAFCSTLYGEYDLAINPASYVNQRLRVDPGNRATPESAVLHYRLQAPPYGVVAVANIRVLQTELLGFHNDVVLSLQFGTKHVWAIGNGEYLQVPNHVENTLQLTSAQYGYTVHAGYPAGHFWHTIRQAILMTLPALLLIGLMTSAAGYWGLFRRTLKRSPSAQD